MTPEFFENVEAFLVFGRLRVKRIGISITATPNDSIFSSDFTIGGRGPASMKNTCGDARGLLTKKFTCVLVEPNKSRRIWRWNISVGPINTI